MLTSEHAEFKKSSHIDFEKMLMLHKRPQSCLLSSSMLKKDVMRRYDTQGILLTFVSTMARKVHVCMCAPRTLFARIHTGTRLHACCSETLAYAGVC